jgi:hypothetical protein
MHLFGDKGVVFEYNNMLRDLTGNHENLKQWFFMGVTPAFKIHKGQKHTFPGGLPLYYGPKTDLTSIYLAVMESDLTSRDTGEALKQLIGSIDINPLMDAALALTDISQPNIALIKPAFSLAIKAIEEVLIRNGDDIEYTNVLTFKQSNSFLIGSHGDWGNHRVDLTFNIEEL